MGRWEERNNYDKEERQLGLLVRLWYCGSYSGQCGALNVVGRESFGRLWRVSYSGFVFSAPVCSAGFGAVLLIASWTATV